MDAGQILGNTHAAIKALRWQYQQPKEFDPTTFVFKLVEMGLAAKHQNLEHVTVGQVRALAAKYGRVDNQQALALARELEQIAAAAAGAAELKQAAALVVQHYQGQSDDFVVSVGAWCPDKVLGPPHTEFSAYMGIPMSDWRRYTASAP